MIKCALQLQRKSNQRCPNHYFTIIIHKSNQIKCWFLMRGENRSTSHDRVEDQQTQSTYDTDCGNRTRATLVEGKCSHHQANAPIQQLFFCMFLTIFFSQTDHFARAIAFGSMATFHFSNVRCFLQPCLHRATVIAFQSNFWHTSNIFYF